MNMRKWLNVFAGCATLVALLGVGSGCGVDVTVVPTEIDCSQAQGRCAADEYASVGPDASNPYPFCDVDPLICKTVGGMCDDASKGNTLTCDAQSRSPVCIKRGQAGSSCNSGSVCQCAPGLACTNKICTVPSNPDGGTACGAVGQACCAGAAPCPGSVCGTDNVCHTPTTTCTVQGAACGTGGKCEPTPGGTPNVLSCAGDNNTDFLVVWYDAGAGNCTLLESYNSGGNESNLGAPSKENFVYDGKIKPSTNGVRTYSCASTATMHVRGRRGIKICDNDGGSTATGTTTLPLNCI